MKDNEDKKHNAYKKTFKSKNWRSLVNGNTYPIETHENHGHGCVYKGMQDLPKEEYPFTIDYEYTALHHFSTVNFNI